MDKAARDKAAMDKALRDIACIRLPSMGRRMEGKGPWR